MCAVVLKAKLVSVGLSLPGGAASQQDSIHAWAADQVAEVRAALACTRSCLIIKPMVHSSLLMIMSGSTHITHMLRQMTAMMYSLSIY